MTLKTEHCLSRKTRTMLSDYLMSIFKDSKVLILDNGLEVEFYDQKRIKFKGKIRKTMLA